MIELYIIKTAKGYSPKDNWTTYDAFNKRFVDLKTARKWIKDEYGKAKRKPMYIDLKTGGTKRVGYVIGFKTYDYESGKRRNYLEQHWIEFRSCKLIDPIKGE